MKQSRQVSFSHFNTNLLINHPNFNLAPEVFSSLTSNDSNKIPLFILTWRGVRLKADPPAFDGIDFKQSKSKKKSSDPIKPPFITETSNALVYCLSRQIPRFLDLLRGRQQLSLKVWAGTSRRENWSERKWERKRERVCVREREREREREKQVLSCRQTFSASSPSSSFFLPCLSLTMLSLSVHSVRLSASV